MVDGCTHCLSIETREELLRLEKAWYRATYISVKHLAVRITFVSTVIYYRSGPSNALYHR